jgi:hypothetical protein
MDSLLQGSDLGFDWAIQRLKGASSRLWTAYTQSGLDHGGDRKRLQIFCFTAMFMTCIQIDQYLLGSNNTTSCLSVSQPLYILLNFDSKALDGASHVV